MTPRLRLLVDLNIVLDVLQRREPFYLESARVLAAVETGHCTGFLSAHSVTTLFYLFSKDQSAAAARIAITELLQFLEVAPVDQEVIEQALNLPYQDFEDAVQMMAGVKMGAAYVITRDPKDFAYGPLPAIRPIELLAVLGS